MFTEQYFPNDFYFFDLENPLDLQRLENPMLALSSATQSVIVIDEIQRKPELFPILRVLVDREKYPQKFLILGSASRDLIRQSSETLAGRIGYIELPPFTLPEVKQSTQLWLRGGFPRSYLAETEPDSFLWRKSYIATFLERDIPNLGFQIPPQQLQRFWLMLAHYHGQLFNASELARSLGISDHTVRKYLDILAGTFMIRVLSPWFENLKKRQVKSPKIYFRDSGVLYALLGISDMAQLHLHPRLGSFWEGFALEQIITTVADRGEDAYFWATQAEAELDLLILKNNKRLGFEIKYTDTPKVTKSMRIAQQDLKLDQLAVVYPGSTVFPLAKQITAFGFDTIAYDEFNRKLFE
jgi:predicted AAA+ superfamily ATPase